MELRAFEIGGGVAVGMLPMVRPMDVKRPPGSLMSPRTSAEGQGSRSDSIRWSHSNSQWSALPSALLGYSIQRVPLTLLLHRCTNECYPLLHSISLSRPKCRRPSLRLTQ